MAQKHVAFAPASQKQLGSRLRSPKPIEEIASYNKTKERMENGIKNLKGARLFPKTFSNTELEMLTWRI